VTVGIELLNIERYPIDDLDSDRGQGFLVECRQRMAIESSLILPGFVRPEVVGTIINDLEAAETIGDEKLRTPYSWRYNLDFPSGHPRRALFRSSINSILADSFPANGLAARLFDCDELTEFVRRLLDVETLYPSACPTMSLMASVLHEGDENGWHFDTNDGVVSILLQPADDGGHFEFVPYIRDETDENYDQVGAVFQGEVQPVRLALEPGTFALFLGRRSIHRVTPVGPTSKPRLILLLSYDHQPGMAFTEDAQNSVRFPTRDPFLGEPVPT
jgi:hypothetical protein